MGVNMTGEGVNITGISSPAATARGIKTNSPFFFTNLIEKTVCFPSGVSFISYSLSARLRLMV